MMKMFSIHDIKANVYNTPFFSINHIEATRSFTSACNDPKTNLCNYPEDFELNFIGIWDEDKGKMTLLEKPEFILSALQAQKSFQSQQQFQSTDITKLQNDRGRK